MFKDRRGCDWNAFQSSLVDPVPGHGSATSRGHRKTGHGSSREEAGRVCSHVPRERFCPALRREHTSIASSLLKSRQWKRFSF